MQVVNSIKKARSQGVGDALILGEIRKQNSDKELFFKKAEERGATPTQILDEIIKQNTKEEKGVPVKETKATPASFTPQQEVDFSLEEKENEEIPTTADKSAVTTKPGRVLLTKEAKAKEENDRKNFLKRIEAKERGEDVGGGDTFAFSPTTTENRAEKEQAMRGEQEIGGNQNKGPSKKLIIIVAVTGLILLGIFIFFIIRLL